MGKLQINGDISFTGAITTPGNDTVVIKPALNNYDQIGASDCKFWKIHATTFYGNLSGNADTATTASAVAWANITGKPSTFAPSSHTHDYLPTSGGTVSGGLWVAGSSGEIQLGLNYGSGSRMTYLYSQGAGKNRGLYDNHVGSIFLITDSGTTFYGSITGNAATASSVAWSNITGKPSSFTPASHSHSGYASIAAHNNLTASGNEFTFASSAFSGVMYVNYRTASGNLDGSISEYRFQNGAGSETAIRCSYMYGTAQAADYATSAGYAGYLPSYTEYSSTSSLDGFLTNGVLRWAKVNSAALSFGNDGSVISVGWGGGYGSQVWLDDGSGPAKIAVRNRSGGSSWNAWRHCIMSCSETYYGSSLPSSGNTGDVFFKT